MICIAPGRDLGGTGGTFPESFRLPMLTYPNIWERRCSKMQILVKHVTETLHYDQPRTSKQSFLIVLQAKCVRNHQMTKKIIRNFRWKMNFFCKNDILKFSLKTHLISLHMYIKEPITGSRLPKLLRSRLIDS